MSISSRAVGLAVALVVFAGCKRPANKPAAPAPAPTQAAPAQAAAAPVAVAPRPAHAPNDEQIAAILLAANYTDISYAKLAQAYGLYGEGPVTDPNDLQAAYKRGLERVKKGEPALIDVVTQPR